MKETVIVLGGLAVLAFAAFQALFSALHPLFVALGFGG